MSDLKKIEADLDRLKRLIHEFGSFDAAPDNLLDAYTTALQKRDALEFEHFLKGGADGNR